MTTSHSRLARLAILGLSTLLHEQGSSALALDARNIALLLLLEGEEAPEPMVNDGNALRTAVPLSALLRPLDEQEDDEEDHYDEDLPPGLRVLDANTPEGLAQLQQLMDLDPDLLALDAEIQDQEDDHEDDQEEEPSIDDISALFNQDVPSLRRQSDLVKEATSSPPRNDASSELTLRLLRNMAAPSLDLPRPPASPREDRPSPSGQDLLQAEALRQERVRRVRSRTPIDTPYSSGTPARQDQGRRTVTGSPVPVRLVPPAVHTLSLLGPSSQEPQYSEEEIDPTPPSIFFDRVESSLLLAYGEAEGGRLAPALRSFFEDATYKSLKRALCQAVSSAALGLHPPSACLPALRALEEFSPSFFATSPPQAEEDGVAFDVTLLILEPLQDFLQQVRSWVELNLEPQSANPENPDPQAPYPMRHFLSLQGEVGLEGEVPDDISQD